MRYYSREVDVKITKIKGERRGAVRKDSVDKLIREGLLSRPFRASVVRVTEAGRAALDGRPVPAPVAAPEPAPVETTVTPDVSGIQDTPAPEEKTAAQWNGLQRAAEKAVAEEQSHQPRRVPFESTDTREAFASADGGLSFSLFRLPDDCTSETLLEERAKKVADFEKAVVKRDKGKPEWKSFGKGHVKLKPGKAPKTDRTPADVVKAWSGEVIHDVACNQCGEFDCTCVREVASAILANLGGPVVDADAIARGRERLTGQAETTVRHECADQITMGEDVADIEEQQPECEAAPAAELIHTTSVVALADGHRISCVCGWVQTSPGMSEDHAYMRAHHHLGHVRFDMERMEELAAWALQFPGETLAGERIEPYEGDHHQEENDGFDWSFTTESGRGYRLWSPSYKRTAGEWNVGRGAKAEGSFWWAEIGEDNSLTAAVAWCRKDSASAEWAAGVVKQYGPMKEERVAWSAELVETELEPNVWRFERYGRVGIATKNPWGWESRPTGWLAEAGTSGAVDGMFRKRAIHRLTVAGLREIPLERWVITGTDGVQAKYGVHGKSAMECGPGAWAEPGLCIGACWNKNAPARFVADILAEDGVTVTGTVGVCALHLARPLAQAQGHIGNPWDAAYELCGKTSGQWGSALDWEERYCDLVAEMVTAALDAGESNPRPDVVAALLAEAEAVRVQQERKAAKSAQKSSNRSTEESMVGRGSMAPKRKATAAKVGDIVFSAKNTFPCVAELRGHRYVLRKLAGSFSAQHEHSDGARLVFEGEDPKNRCRTGGDMFPNLPALKRAILADAVARGEAQVEPLVEPVVEEEEPAALPKGLKVQEQPEGWAVLCSHHAGHGSVFITSKLTDRAAAVEAAWAHVEGAPGQHKGAGERAVQVSEEDQELMRMAAEEYAEELEAAAQLEAEEAAAEEWDAEEAPEVSPGVAVQRVNPQGEKTDGNEGMWWAHCNGGREDCYRYGHIVSPDRDTSFRETEEGARALGEWHVEGEQGPAPTDDFEGQAQASRVVWASMGYEFIYRAECTECDAEHVFRGGKGTSKTAAAKRRAVCDAAVAWTVEHAEQHQDEESAEKSPADIEKIQGQGPIPAGESVEDSELADVPAPAYDPRPRAQRWEVRRAKEVLTAAGFNDHDADSSSGAGFVVINDMHAVAVVPVLNGDHRRPRKLADRKLWDEALEEFADVLREAGFTGVGINPHRVRGFAPVPTEPQTTARVRDVNHWVASPSGYRLRAVTFDGHTEIECRIGFHTAGAGASVFHLQDHEQNQVPAQAGETLTESVERLCDWYGLPEPFAVMYEEAEEISQTSAGESSQDSAVADTAEIPVKPQPTPGLYAPTLHTEERTGDVADDCREGGHRYVWLVIEAEGVARILRSYLTCQCSGEKLGNFGRSGPSMSQGTQRKPLGIRDASIASALGVAKRNDYTPKGPWEIVSDTLKRCSVEWDHAKPLKVAVDPNSASQRRRSAVPEHAAPCGQPSAWRIICGAHGLFMPRVPRTLAKIEKQVRTEMVYRVRENRSQLTRKERRTAHAMLVREYSSERTDLTGYGKTLHGKQDPTPPAVREGESIRPMNPGWAQEWWLFADVYGYGFEVSHRNEKWTALARLDEWQSEDGKVSLPGKLVRVAKTPCATAEELLDLCREVGEKRAVRDAGTRMVQRVITQGAEPVEVGDAVEAPAAVLPSTGRGYWEIGERVIFEGRAGRVVSATIGKTLVEMDGAEPGHLEHLEPRDLVAERYVVCGSVMMPTMPERPVRDWFAAKVAPASAVEEDGPDYAAISRANRSAAVAEMVVEEDQEQPLEDLPAMDWESLTTELAELRTETRGGAAFDWDDVAAELAALRELTAEGSEEVGEPVLTWAQVEQELAELRQEAVPAAVPAPVVRTIIPGRLARESLSLAASAALVTLAASQLAEVMPVSV
ncbi:hypothetical protein [Streptomyces sp. NPDC088762]|uniref:hypothetical protein n=1 Tax=Streptomyces sp. NPDC088762 TaxID=3365891 RepID=UPI003805A07B